MNKIAIVLKDLLSSLQAAKIYTTDHRLFTDSLDKAYNELKSILADRGELIIGIVGDELASGKEIFFDLSKKLKTIISFFKKRGIERIVFKQPLKREELLRFISCLAKPPEGTDTELKDYFHLIGIENISVGKVGMTTESKTEDVEQILQSLSPYEESLEHVSSSIDAVLDGEAIQYLDVRYTVLNVMENLMGKHQEFLKLTDIRRHDFSTFIHLLNVSVLAMYFSFRMGFSKDDVLDIGTAAIFHDIGKIYISKKIIQKPESLTDKEFLKIKSHTVIGVEVLLKYRDVLGMLPPVVAFEHHLRYDLGGYPKLFFPQKLHQASLIVSICDVYDALIQRRSYKRDYPPNMVHNIMMKEKGTMFKPDLLDKFFEIIGVWPVDTIVSLTDGRVAIVREQNDDDIFSPKVEVVTDEGKRTLIDLKQSKGTLSIDHSLNPLGEGKRYLSFI